MSKQVTVQKSTQVWTLATSSLLHSYGTLSKSKYSGISLEKYTSSRTQVESTMDSVSCIKTPSTSEINNGLLALHTS